MKLMTHYRITISGPTNEAIADLVLKRKINILGNIARHSKDTEISVDAIVQPNEIQLL